MMPRINISSRNGRMIWVRIFRVGMVSRLANAAPVLGGNRVGRTVENELVGAAVLRRKAIRDDGVGAGVAGRNLNRCFGDNRPVALAVQPDPCIEDPAANAIG